MALAWIATGNAGNSGGDATQVDVPVAGTPTSGDFLCIHVSTQSTAGGTWNTPSGWTQLSVQRNNTAAFYKIAAGGETTVTVSRDGASARCLGRMMLIRGETGATLSLDASNSADSLTVSTMTPTKEGTLWVWLASRESDSGDFSSYAMTTDDPGSWTERYEDDQAGQLTIAGATSAVRTATSATGNCTVTGSSTGAGFVFAVAQVANASPSVSALSLTVTQPASVINTNSNVPVSAIALTATTPTPTPSTQEFPTFTNTTKNAETATNTSKNAATASNTSKNSATATNQSKTQS